MKDTSLPLQLLVVGLVIIGLAFGMVSSYRQLLPVEEVDDSLGSATQGAVIITGTSTSSPTYLATSTLPVTKDIRIGEDADYFCQTMYLDSSSTDSVLLWRYYFSNDGIEWYGEQDNPVVSSGTYTHGAATTTHSWTPAIAGVRLKQDCIPNMGERLNTKYLRIEYDKSGSQDVGSMFSEGFFKASY